MLVRALYKYLVIIIIIIISTPHDEDSVQNSYHLLSPPFAYYLGVAKRIHCSRLISPCTLLNKEQGSLSDLLVEYRACRMFNNMFSFQHVTPEHPSLYVHSSLTPSLKTNK